MGLKFYTKLKIKLAVATFAIIIIFLAALFVENYFFIYKSNYEHINFHEEGIYKIIFEEFHEDDFIYNGEKFDKQRYLKTESFLNSLGDIMYDVESVYTLKKLDDGKIVYLSYAEKGDNLLNYANLFVGKEISEDLFEEVEKIFDLEERVVIDEPELFSGEDDLRYIYPFYNSQGQIIGVVGIDSDGSVIKNIASSTLAKIMSYLIVFVLVFIFFIFILFYKVFNSMFNMVVYTDNLTKLKNRAAYEEYVVKIDNIIKNEPEKNIHILVFDLNDLKFANDNFGHLAGDKYIKDAGKIINESFSDIGTTYRVGGDEFTTVVLNSSDDVVKSRIEQIQKNEDSYNEKENSCVFMSISVGYDSVRAGHDLNLTSVLKRADEKMYKDKKMKKLKIKELRLKKEAEK